MQRTLIKQHR